MIKIENLTKVFRTENVETTALNGVSLEAESIAAILRIRTQN